MTGFADIHSHFIYGVDDGPATAEDMYAMLDAAYENGIRQLYATSHVIPGMKAFAANLYREHLQQARIYCESRHYDIQLFEGAEILYTPQMAWYADSKQLPVLEGTRAVLIEFSPQIVFKDICAAVELLIRNGYKPIIAHVERYAFMMKPGAMSKLKRLYDVRYQVNAGTVLRRASFITSFKLNRWFKANLIDFIASDAHNV